jgi:hypothetical protein
LGIEPKTNGLKVQCSTAELYTLKINFLAKYKKNLLNKRKVKEGIEPSLMNLQFTTLPLCYLTTINENINLVNV